MQQSIKKKKSSNNSNSVEIIRKIINKVKTKLNYLNFHAYLTRREAIQHNLYVSRLSRLHKLNIIE
jgi:hypothetical protein